MAEYDLVCDACGKPVEPDDAVVSWSSAEGIERGFALTHTAHVPAQATQRLEGRQAVWPSGYLWFVTDRLGKRVEDLDALKAILAALAPFVMRPDNPTEMDSMRAASFGQRLGVKPGAAPSAVAAGAQEPHEGGK
ncbi:MAG: hypothetical protein KGN00_08575 [Chloroflexota bacterium]|nr:hypothetical protein [Chloroflexota bacterium]MDE3193723.1 hypothetical protein [Chloroflexota bacterium]